MKVPWSTSCIVLAGGSGSRLGRDKVLETVGGKSLLQRVVNVVSSFCSGIIIVTAGGKSFPQLRGHPRLRIVSDIYAGKGIVGGLYTGMVTSNSFYNLVVASDMPFLNKALLRYMIQLATGFDAVVPRLGNMVEPLHGVYSKRCIDPLEWMIKQGSLKFSDVLSLVRVRHVKDQEIDRFDPKHLSVFNINTEADLAGARELAKGDLSDVKR